MKRGQSCGGDSSEATPKPKKPRVSKAKAVKKDECIGFVRSPAQLEHSGCKWCQTQRVAVLKQIRQAKQTAAVACMPLKEQALLYCQPLTDACYWKVDFLIELARCLANYRVVNMRSLLPMAMLEDIPFLTKFMETVKDNTFRQVFRCIPSKVLVQPEAREMIKLALQLNPYEYLSLPASLQCKVDIFEHTTENYCNDIYQSAPLAIRDDKSILLNLLAKSTMPFRYASERLRDDKEVVLYAVGMHGRCYLHASPRLQLDKEVCMLAVTRECDMFALLPEVMQDNNEIANIAINTYGQLMMYASRRYRSDAMLVLPHLNRGSMVLDYVDPSLLENYQFGLAVVDLNPEAFQNLSEKLKRNKEFVMECFQLDFTNRRTLPVRSMCGIVLPKTVNADMSEDESFMITACESNGMNWSRASNTLRTTSEALMCAALRNGLHPMKVPHVPPHLRQNYNVAKVVLDQIKRKAGKYPGVLATDCVHAGVAAQVKIVHLSMALKSTGRPLCDDLLWLLFNEVLEQLKME